MHPAAFVTVTVYVVVPAGESVIVADVALLFHQEYVPPPLAVSVVLCPVQIFVLPVMVAEGCGFTVMVMGDGTLSHPPTVTVAVYTVVEAGETTIVGLVAPVLHE